jgi:LmbE family N-acetylglucosaminyl deacetylase
MKVMFVGAHPDDAEIYAFGTLFAYAERGAEIVLVLATAGEGGLTARSKHQPLAKARMEEAEQAAAMLLARVIALGMPDGALSPFRMPLLRQLIELFAAERPDLILTHSPNDYHPDHRVLSGAVALAAAEHVPVFLVDNMKGRNFRPTHYVNIKDYQAQKMLALRQHQSQKPRRYVLAATALAEERGFEATGKLGALMEGLRFDPTPAFKTAEQLLPRGTIAAPPVLFRRPDPAPDSVLLSARAT